MQRTVVFVVIVSGTLQHPESHQTAERSESCQAAHRCMQEASRAVARLAPMSGPLMPPTRRARAPPVVCIVGAPGHCPAAATPHRILEGTAHRGSQLQMQSWPTVMPLLPARTRASAVVLRCISHSCSSYCQSTRACACQPLASIPPQAIHTIHYPLPQ